jgi:hypothetical protein
LKTGKNKNDLNTINSIKDKLKNKVNTDIGRDSSNEKINKSSANCAKDGKKDKDLNSSNQNQNSASVQRKEKAKESSISKPKSPKKSNKVDLESNDYNVVIFKIIKFKLLTKLTKKYFKKFHIKRKSHDPKVQKYQIQI